MVILNRRICPNQAIELYNLVKPQKRQEKVEEAFATLGSESAGCGNFLPNLIRR
jgi:hypothetical protein